MQRAKIFASQYKTFCGLHDDSISAVSGPVPLSGAVTHTIVEKLAARKFKILPSCGKF